MFHTRLNNFPVFRNYRDIDFALSCMDVLAKSQCSNHNELKFDVKFCEIKAEDFLDATVSNVPSLCSVTDGHHFISN